MRALGSLLLTIVTAAPFVTAAPCAAQTDKTGRARPPKFEVCVVGTIHAPWQFRWPGISPAHIRAALVKLQPDVIGVESHPEWFAKGVYHDVTYEAEGVAMPFAKQHDIPVYGIDWLDIPAYDRRVAERARERIAHIQKTAAERVLPSRMFGEQSPAFLEPHAESWQFFFTKDQGFAQINQIENDDWARQWLRGDTKAEDFGGHRNQQIVEHCVAAMAKHPAKRLVVVIGAGHKAVLDTLFARLPGVRVLRLGRDIAAPTAAEVRAATTMEDLVVTLGHNIDGERSCFHQELIDVPRMQDFIARLRESAGHRPHANYFAARLALLTGDLSGAAKHLDAVGDQEPRAKLYPYPMGHWRMMFDLDQAVRVARAELARASGKPELAAKHLAGLAAAITIPELPKDLHTRGKLVTKISARPSDWAPNGADLKLVTNTLVLTAEQVAKPKMGMAAITHQVTLANTTPLHFECAVRARHRACGAVEIYERDPAGRMLRLGTSNFQFGTRWAQVGTDFQVRDPQRPIWIYVYLDARPGTRFGVRDMQILQPPKLQIPPHWIPRKLAREYLRALTAK